MQITINGTPTDLSEPVSIIKLLEKNKLDPTTVVVELNKEIIDSAAFTNTMLKDGDCVEVLRFVGGG